MAKLRAGNNAERREAAMLAGTWTLVSFAARRPSGGEERFPFGTDPVGQLIYTTSGHMSVVFTRRNRPKFASADLGVATPEELKSAFEGLEAYAGTYEINLERRTVTHRLQVCRYPNWEGGSQVRHFVFDGDKLLLSTPPITVREQEWLYTLTWSRRS